MARKNSPTRRGRSEKGSSERGVKPPEIFVRLPGRHEWQEPRYMAARLRNKGGYVYLQFRERGKVRSVYVGRAKKSSPTQEISSSPATSADRRAKKRRG